jgi:CDP-glycerol glycerophosphotransferase (TagB/SpsB family)
MRDAMLEWAGHSTGTDFVFMPHPALLPFPDSEFSPISRAEFDQWMAAWVALPNTEVLSEADYGPTLAASDVMVTDGLSMLVEYQLFGKPLIFFEREGHRPFNAIGQEVVGGVHTVHTVDEARAAVEGFLDGAPDPLRDRQAGIARRLLGAGDSAELILKVLQCEIALERGGSASTSRPI